MAPWLPKTLDGEPRVLWRKRLMSEGVGGLAATSDRVIVSGRALNDQCDHFRCLRLTDGESLWQRMYPAPGRLDYGNSPRATPLIDGDRAYLFGAMGHLTAVDLSSGAMRWQQDILFTYGVTSKQVWGTSSSPLIVDGSLWVNPGAPEASVVALDRETGAVQWKRPGDEAAFASFVVCTLGGVRQVVGYTKASLGGWHPSTGERLWSLTPSRGGDFNVPTPIAVDDRHLLVTTENNFTRLYAFDDDGLIVPDPVAFHRKLAPDSSTPVVLGRRVFGVWDRLYCLDLDAELAEVWVGDDPAFERYASVIGAGDRLLVTTLDGTLILVDASADEYRECGRWSVFEGDSGVYSSPALVGERLVVRGSREVVCLDLGGR